MNVSPLEKPVRLAAFPNSFGFEPAFASLLSSGKSDWERSRRRSKNNLSRTAAAEVLHTQHVPCSALAASVVYFEKRKKQFREKNNKAKSSLDQMIESLFPILTTLWTVLSKGCIFDRSTKSI